MTASSHQDPAAHGVASLAGTRVQDCYQCGKCTAGCPMADKMDLMPNQLVRLVQLGQEARAMKSEAVWLCVSCQTCSTRCPKKVDCAAVLDALRQLAYEQGVASSAQRRTLLFQKAFLDNIRRNGRLSEMELVGRFKTSVFFSELSVPFLMKDAMLGPKMMTRGKLHLKSAKARDLGVVERIFARCLAEPHPAGDDARAKGSH